MWLIISTLEDGKAKQKSWEKNPEPNDASKKREKNFLLTTDGL